MNRILPCARRLACLLITVVLAPPCYPQAYKAPAPSPRRTALIDTFAVAGQPAPDPATLSSKSCPTEPTKFRIAAPIEPKLLAAIGNELKLRLAKTISAEIATTPAIPTPPPDLIFAGCIIASEPGDPAERQAGMRIGASYLAAHVRIYTGASTKPIQEFDVDVSGGKLLPYLGPFGLTTRAATMEDQSLDGDAPRLADELLRKFAKLEKAAGREPLIK